MHFFAFLGNYSVAGFELTLRRKVSHYIITYYLPSGMFVIVSWISFLVPPEIVPGRMTLLVTVFLVLVNIFNTITTNIPKAEGLTGNEKNFHSKLFLKLGRKGLAKKSESLFHTWVKISFLEREFIFDHHWDNWIWALLKCSCILEMVFFKCSLKLRCCCCYAASSFWSFAFSESIRICCAWQILLHLSCFGFIVCSCLALIKIIRGHY